MEKIKWSEKVTNEQVLGLIGEKRTLINNIHRKANWIGYILRRNCLLHDAIEGQMTGVKERYWELKEENEDRKRWNTQFNIRNKYISSISLRTR